MATEYTEELFDQHTEDDAHATTSVTHEEYGDDYADDHGEFHVALKADTLWMVGNYPVTNSLLTSVFGSVILVLLVLALSLRLRMVPGKMQSLFELIIEKGYDFTLTTLDGNESIARKTFPLVASLFVFILFFNLIKFIPGFESLKYNGLHFFKPIHADFNMTLALGITAFIFVQVMGIFVLGVLKYATKFINIKKPLTIPLGVIELISEAAKLVSLSFRLFGNILVGGILLLLVAHTMHFVAPVPVMLFEVFVALLQAGIFALLTLIYVKLAIDEPH